MILLDSTTKTLEIILGAGVAVQLPVVADYLDITNGAQSGISDTTTTTNSTTAVTVVSAPAAGVVRHVKFLSVRNVNSAAVTVKLRINNNSTTRVIVAASLSQDETLTYIDGVGVQVLNWNGEQKESAILINLTTQVTGTLPVVNGGTGDATLAAHGVLIGNGTSAVTVLAPDASTTKVLTCGGVSADPSWQPVTATGTVTHTAGSLTANAVVLGNGSADITVLGSLGTTTTVLHGNAAGAPTFGAVDLTADVTGTLPVNKGGTGAATLTAHGVVLGNGTSAVAVTTAGTTGYPLVSGGASADGAYAILKPVGGGVGAATVALVDGATPALDASLGTVFRLPATGDRTIAVPTNATDGQKLVIQHFASGGGRTLALNSGAGGFRFGTDITALTATASGKTDYIGCIYNATDSKWDVVAYTKGF